MCGCECFAQETYDLNLSQYAHALCTRSVRSDDDTKLREKMCVQQVVLCTHPVAHMAVATVCARNYNSKHDQVRRSTEKMAANCNGFPLLVAFFLVH